MTSKHQVAAIHRELSPKNQMGADAIKVSVVVAIALVGAGCREVQKPMPAWGAGIDAELRRFGADVLGLGQGTDASGAWFNGTWEYSRTGCAAGSRSRCCREPMVATGRSFASSNRHDATGLGCIPPLGIVGNLARGL